jgi:hypothetical protein
LSVFLQAFGDVIDTEETLRLMSKGDHRGLVAPSSGRNNFTRP